MDVSRVSGSGSFAKRCKDALNRWKNVSPKNRSDYKIPDEFKIGQLAYISIERSSYFLGVESCTKPGETLF